MLTHSLTHLRAASQCVWQQARRNIGCSAVLAQKVDDPIQQLFIQKIREFAEKKKAAGGKISDIPPESKRSLDLELSRLEKQYKAEGVDMTKFPNFQFQDQALETSRTKPDSDPTNLPL